MTGDLVQFQKEQLLFRCKRSRRREQEERAGRGRRSVVCGCCLYLHGLALLAPCLLNEERIVAVQLLYLALALGKRVPQSLAVALKHLLKKKEKESHVLHLLFGGHRHRFGDQRTVHAGRCDGNATPAQHYCTQARLPGLRHATMGGTQTATSYIVGIRRTVQFRIWETDGRNTPEAVTSDRRLRCGWN